MPHKSAPIWRQIGFPQPHRRSARHTAQIYNPLKRRRAYWKLLAKPELRLLMAGLVSWEQRSRGPVRSRVRRKRLDAVAYYGRRFGALARGSLWTERKAEWRSGPLHSPRKENARGVLWHEA